MTSYFDLKPRPKGRIAELADLPTGESNEGFRRDRLLSPQVSRILDDLDDGSSSGDSDTVSDASGEGDEGAVDEKGDSSDTPKVEALHQIRFDPSPAKEAKEQRPLPRLSRHPRLERFVSLRSSLLSSHIADNMSKIEQEQGGKWMAEHEGRKRANTSKDARQMANTSKEGSHSARRNSEKGTLAHRMGKSLRKLTGSNVPTLKGIREGTEPSSSSSNEKSAPTEDSGKRDSGHASGDDELLRWTSQVDPPSDGSSGHKRKGKGSKHAKESHPPKSGHDGLEAEDVDELVHWLSKQPKPTQEASESQNNQTKDPSRASTEADSDEDASSVQDFADEDINGLVRWISQNRKINEGYHKANQNTPTPKLQQHDSTQSGGSRRSQRAERPISEYSTATQEDRASILGDDDVPELIRTVTRDECSHDDEKKREAAILRWKIEKERQESHGKPDKQHQGELSEEDIDELVKWVSRRASVGGTA
jgi:hypothetical protein